jgi:hypothetical protein
MAIGFFATMFLVGIALSAIDQTEKRVLFTTFKDLIPFLIAIPAAWLGYCVQRRSAYLQQLRSLWSKLIEAVQSGAQYTCLTHPSQDDRAKALVKISVAIDEIRGVFCNLGESGVDDGLYPFEPLKDIHREVAELGWGDSFDPQPAKLARQRIFALWKDARRELLKEFDREEPEFPHSHWADLTKARVYEDHEIPKRPS